MKWWPHQSRSGKFVSNNAMLIGLGLFFFAVIMVVAIFVLEVSLKYRTAKLVSTPDYDIGESVGTLFGVGDIADCGAPADLATSKLLKNASLIFTVGDNVYATGTSDRFNKCFEPTWGKYKSVMRPALGNHDYEVKGAADYFAYFGDLVGKAGAGYYSYDLGNWHIVVLDSDCYEVGGCSENSAQGQWLKNDLASHKSNCTLAYWHHPRFNSGEHGDEKSVADFWKLLYGAGAELVINGHAHDYERFAPQNPEGVFDANLGIRELIVGTGGKSLHTTFNRKNNSEVFNNKTYGVLKLNLSEKGYRWRFAPIDGSSFTDFGSGLCH